MSATPPEPVTRARGIDRYQVAVKRHMFLYTLPGLTLLVFGGVLQQYFAERTVGTVLMIVGLLALFAVVIPAADGSPSSASDSGGATDGLPSADGGHGHHFGSFGDFGGHGGGH
jgi:hypothetical protein